MSSRPPKFWTVPLAKRLDELRLEHGGENGATGWSVEQLARAASKVDGCDGITHEQVRRLLNGPPTLNPLVVLGVSTALGLDSAAVEALKKEGMGR